MAFKPGDQVQIKSGGPPMTVEAVEGDDVKVVWYDQKTKATKKEKIKAVALRPYEEPGPGIGIY